MPGLPCFRRETKKEKLSSGAATECRILSVIGLLGGLSAHRFDGRTAINDFGGSRRRRPRVQPGRPPGIRVKLALRGRVQGGPQRREACYPDVWQPGYNMSASDGLKIATDLSLRSRKKRSSPVSGVGRGVADFRSHRRYSLSCGADDNPANCRRTVRKRRPKTDSGNARRTTSSAKRSTASMKAIWLSRVSYLNSFITPLSIDEPRSARPRSAYLACAPDRPRAALIKPKLQPELAEARRLRCGRPPLLAARRGPQRLPSEIQGAILIQVCGQPRK